MIGLMLAAAAVGALADQVTAAPPGQLEVIPAVTLEARAGEAPINPGQPPTTMGIEILTPGVGLNYVGQRLELQAGYELRIFWRNVSGDLAPTPLLLHTVNLTLTGRPTRRLVLKLTGLIYEGEPDYTFLPSIFGANQATLAAPPKILSGNLTAGAELHVTQLVTAGITFQATHSQQLGQESAASGFTLPDYTSLAATPGVAVRISRTDDLSSGLAFEYQHLSEVDLTDASGNMYPGSTVSAFSVTPTLGFHRLLSSRSQFTLTAGLDANHLDNPVSGTSNTLNPIGSAALDLRLMDLRRAVLQARLNESLQYYLDPILGTEAYHSFFTGDLFLGLPKNWTIALEGSFVTTLAAHPTAVAQPPPLPPVGYSYPDEVAASARLAGRHLLSNDLLLESGVRWSDRSPFYTAPTFGFHERELFFYVMLSASTHPTWVTRREVAAVQ